MRSTDTLLMSGIEVDRLAVFKRIFERRLNRSDGAQQLGITSKHMSRLVAAYTTLGAQALVSKQRGATSNNALPLSTVSLPSNS